MPTGPLDFGRGVLYNRDSPRTNMSIQLILMKSGEEVIADVYETRSETSDDVGFILRDPQIVRIMKNMEDPEAGPNVTFENWAPLSSERRFLVKEHSFITITNPVQALTDHYVERFGAEDEQLTASSSTQEQQSAPDTDGGDGG